MLELDEGRISFADALRPPEGYELSFAVGTTYSLDLKALLGLCIPLGLGFEPEALSNINPVSLFAALRELQGKLAIFCDKGSIRASIPSGARGNGLLMLLEGMVHQVHVSWRRKDALSSFHPKVWVVEYVPHGKGDSLFRLLVMSRNLSFDTSWDAVVALDGHPGEGDACSEHVAQFLEFLANGDAQTSTETDDSRRRGSHTARIRKLAQAIRGARFEVDDANFERADFFPFGPQSSDEPALMDASECELLTTRWRDMLVVSPFLGGGEGSPLGRMSELRSGALGRFVLLSREDSLADLDEQTRAAYECFCPASSLADVELDGGGDVDAASYSDLHAKIYFGQDANSSRHLYLGSLNASRNGFANNVEALLRLDVRPKHLTFQDMLRPLIGDDDNVHPPFVPFVAPNLDDGESDGEREFARAFRVASRLVSFKQATVRVDDDGASMDVVLSVASRNKACEGIELRMRPLLSTEWFALELGTRIHDQSLVFRALKPEQISSFFVIEGKDADGRTSECVTVCPHDKFDDAQLSLESRSSVLLGAILTKDGGALSQYIAHAFDLPEASFGIDGEERTDKGQGTAGRFTIPPGIYERLLDMASTNPSVFERASHLMDLIPDEVRNKDVDALRRMLDAFRGAVG